jgi:hypothetical protein
MVEQADIIAIVTPEAKDGEQWDRLEIMVASRYRLKVVRTIKGDLDEGDVIFANAFGGDTRATFAAHGPRKPSVGEPTVSEEDVESPWYVPGRTELVFLSDVGVVEGVGQVYFDLALGSRYVVDGQDISLPEPVTYEYPIALPDSDWRWQAAALSLDELLAEIRRRLD